MGETGFELARGGTVGVLVWAKQGFKFDSNFELVEGESIGEVC